MGEMAMDWIVIKKNLKEMQIGLYQVFNHRPKGQFNFVLRN